MQVLSCPKKPFTSTTSGELGEVFNGLENTSANAVAILLPEGYDEGEALGYSKELLRDLEEKFPHTGAYYCDWPLFGSYIRGASLLLVGSQKPFSFDDMVLIPRTFNEMVPEAIRHAPKHFNLNSLARSTAQSAGFEYSHLHALPEIEMWGGERLIIEVLVDGNVSAYRKITREELGALFGGKERYEVEDVLHLIPQAVTSTVKEVLAGLA